MLEGGFRLRCGPLNGKVQSVLVLGPELMSAALRPHPKRRAEGIMYDQLEGAASSVSQQVARWRFWEARSLSAGGGSPRQAHHGLHECDPQQLLQKAGFQKRLVIRRVDMLGASKQGPCKEDLALRVQSSRAVTGRLPMEPMPRGDVPQRCICTVAA